MTYVGDLDAYGLHPRNEKLSTTLLTNDRVSYYTHVRGSLLFKSIFCILTFMTIYDCVFFSAYILSLVFLSFKLYMYCLIFKTKNLYIGVFRVCCEHTSFLIFDERCTPQVETLLILIIRLDVGHINFQLKLNFNTKLVWATLFT